MYTLNTDLDISRDINKEGDDSRLYLRYDEAGVQPIPGTARSHHLPFAIPASRTIPRHLADDMAYHLSQRRNTTSRSVQGKSYRLSHDYSKDHRTLYLYNPHVLPLHNTIEISGSSKSDPDFLSKSDLHALTGGDSSVRYLVTYRAFLGCNCFGILPKRQIMRAGEMISYLAIALLDEHLDVINGTDVLVDFNLSPQKGGRNDYVDQFREDCRTFLINRQIQILCNNKIHRVQIRRTGDKGAQTIPDPGSKGTGDDFRVPYIYENIHGDGLEVTLTQYSSNIHAAKNMNIFRSLVLPPENTDVVIENKEHSYDHYLQIWPIPHGYNRIRSIQNPKKNIQINPNFMTYSTASLPSLSFDTPDTTATRLECKNSDDDKISGCTEAPFFPEDIAHGTACCVSMDLEGSRVMVGIMHIKLSRQNPFWKKDKHERYNNFVHDQFLSGFVAYDTKPPFDIVARSGLFCLGFANEDEGLSDIKGSALAGQNTQYRLNLFNDTFDCPVIHFISAFSEVVGDQSKAIIGYGINDCHPRMMIVEKKDIVNRLVGKM